MVTLAQVQAVFDRARALLAPALDGWNLTLEVQDIEAEIGVPAMGWVPRGSLIPERRMARIIIDVNHPDDVAELLDTAIHELLHVWMAPIRANGEQSGGAHMLEEQAVEALTVALGRAAKDAPADVSALMRGMARLARREARAPENLQRRELLRGDGMDQIVAFFLGLLDQLEKGSIDVATAKEIAASMGIGGAAAAPPADQAAMDQAMSRLVERANKIGEKLRAGAKADRLGALLRETGEQDPEAGIGAVRAWRGLEKTVVELQRREAERVAKDELAERRTIALEMVRRGRGRTEVFSLDANGNETGFAEGYRPEDVTLAALRAQLARMPAPRKTYTEVEREGSTIVIASEATRSVAEATKTSVEALAANRQALFGGAQ